MEASSERDYQDRKVGPTVSKDKWVNHARAKMTKGYILIVGKNKRTANFYLKEKGYEMCAYNVAKQLIKDGAVVKTGEHHLGDVYELLMAPATHDAAPRRVADDDSVDEFDVLLNQLDDQNTETGDDSPQPAL